MTEKPNPAFCVGDLVRVILNDRNRTPHIGQIREIIWHFKDEKYNYYLAEGDKKVSKRYFEEDLVRVTGEEE